MTQGAREPEPASRPSTITQGGGRAWVHAATVRGRYGRLRTAVGSVLLVAFFALPWLTLGDLPFIRLSFLASSFVLFGQSILVYELHHFGLLALLLVLTLFFASALHGRVWCGYACPQTVFIEQILGRIETLFEGPAARRIVNAGKPLTPGRLLRKAGKQLAFAAVSFAFAFTLVALFTGPWALLQEESRAAWTAIALLTGLAWFDGAYWREQFCHLICPYGRFQGVLQDAATRTIGYDQRRGEPRHRSKDRDGVGDCIDCGRCVRVCPSGIDIRQGAHQLECIGCARCIDACDEVMTNIGRPRGLVRYDAAAMFVATPPTSRPRLLRPRLVVYGVVWTTVLAVGVWQFLARQRLHVLLLSTPGGAPYFLDQDRVKNLLTLKIGNQDRGSETYDVTLLGGDGLRLESPPALGPIAAGKEATLPLLVSGPITAAGGAFEVLVRARGSGATVQLERRLTGPKPKAQE